MCYERRRAEYVKVDSGGKEKRSNDGKEEKRNEWERRNAEKRKGEKADISLETPWKFAAVILGILCSM